MRDIIIYTIPDKLLHKRDMLENDPDKSENGYYYWRLRHVPKDWLETEESEEARIYFATNGIIQGYFMVDDVQSDTYGYDIEFHWSSWRDLDKIIPVKPFQGFKYADKVEGLK
jgi:hypothetical protein